MKLTSENVAELIDSAKGEREIARFLKANPGLLFWTFFSLGGHLHYVVPEFGLGKALKCDFLLMQSYSTGWKAASRVLGLELTDTEVLTIRLVLVFFGLALLGLIGWILFFQMRRKLRSIDHQLHETETKLNEALKHPHRFQDDCFLDEKFHMYRHKTKPGFFCVACAAEKKLESPMQKIQTGWKCPIVDLHFVRDPDYKESPEPPPSRRGLGLTLEDLDL